MTNLWMPFLMLVTIFPFELFRVIVRLGPTLP